MSINHCFSISALLLSAIFWLSGCQLITNYEQQAASYGEYYLALQQLTETQLAEEIAKQQKQIALMPTNSLQSDYDTQIKLLLLYSLPKSPIYNSFNAKALLNEMKREGNNVAFATISSNEQAFITLLRDQLNQRLLMRNRLLVQQQEQQEQALKQQQILIEQIHMLQQTITQLKKIDQAIDNREQ